MDPFFEYFKRERKNFSQKLYGRYTPSFKEYPRLPKVILPAPAGVRVALDTLLFSRQSTRKYATDAVSLETLSALLYWGFGKLHAHSNNNSDSQQRPHPSGGAKYPIEVYLIILNVEGVQSGVYHYNVPNHTLEKLPQELDLGILKNAYQYSFVAEAGVLVCLTAIKGRSIGTYGALSYKLELIEAGHVGQNFYLATHALGLGCCGLAAGDTATMHDMIGLDGGNEHLVYTIAVGHKM